MSAQKQKEIKAKYFHHELGLEDSELKNISILVNDEEYNDYMNDSVNFFHIYVTRPLDNSFGVKKDCYFTKTRGKPPSQHVSVSGGMDSVK